MRDQTLAKGFSESAPHYHGHRERLRARFCEAGADSVSNYEPAGAGALPRPAAAGCEAARERADREFGSFAEVIAAPPARLREVKGIGETAVTELKIVQAAAVRLARGEAKKRPLLSS
jgi:DNA repair protein RadC